MPCAPRLPLPGLRGLRLAILELLIDCHRRRFMIRTRRKFNETICTTERYVEELKIPADAPTIGGFLYLTVASLAAGMTVSAIRWAVVDTLHSLTGLPLPPLDFSRLGKNVAAYGLLIQIHYVHYQFYSNEAIATADGISCS